MSEAKSAAGTMGGRLEKVSTPTRRGLLVHRESEHKQIRCYHPSKRDYMPNPVAKLYNINANELIRWTDAILAEAADQGRREGQETTIRRRQAAWLTAFVDTYNRAAACRASGVSLSTLDQWVGTDPVFVACKQMATTEVRDNVAGEVYRRAVKGLVKDVWHQGRRVGTQLEYSDRLLELLAKRVDPEAWSGQPQTALGDAGQSRLASAILSDPEALRAAQALADRLEELDTLKSKSIEARQPNPPAN